MKFQENIINNKLKIVITVGDESGIGPEIVLKALSSDEISKDVDFLLVGSKKILQDTFMRLKTLGIKNIVDPNNYKIEDLNIPFETSNPKSSFGNASFLYLQ